MIVSDRISYLQHLESDSWNFEQFYRHKFSGRKLYILCDENTQEACLPLLDHSFGQTFADAELIVVEAGETSKTIEVYQGVMETLIDLNADRSSVLLNLGGGVVTDLGAFVAATFKRGISFINVPTSLLAMVDAAFGSKNGINLGPHKNQIGSFKKADRYILHPGFLNSLDSKQILEGKVEMLKHGLISDPIHWREIEAKAVPTMEQIKRSINIKLDICDKDPYEKNERKKLNFGHSIGHAIEAWAGNRGSSVSHGSAVAVGMICESFLSMSSGLSKEAVHDISEKLMSFHPRINFDSADIEMILNFLGSDKKRVGKKNNFTAISSIGEAVINTNPSQEEIRESLVYYQKFKS